MSLVTDALYILGLFILRLGIPLLITLTIAYFLRRLDARWEREARMEQEAARARKEAGRQVGVQVPAPRFPPPASVPVSMDSYGKPCWEIKDCDPIDMEKCPAPHNPDLPCWQARRQAEGRIPLECYHCELFLAFQYSDSPERDQRLHH